MTFKHIKFQDSPVMRSLEKVAQQKGMIQADLPIKIATAKKINLIPSNSLLDNIVRLCTGLRERGFHKQAADVETHFAFYKQSQTLYETSKEEGKDIIEFAHPEGSHKLVDVEGDEAVFEDILDQMSKAIEVVEKKPTGKLTESQQAIQAVKVILGATPLDVNSLYVQAQDALEKFRSVATSISEKMGEGADYDSTLFNYIKGILDKRSISAAKGYYGSGPFSESLLSVINNMQSGLEPSYLNPLGWGGPSAWSPERQQAWQEVQKFFPLLKKYADRFHAIVSQIESIENQQAGQADKISVQELDPEGKADLLLQKMQGLSNTIVQDIAKVQQKKLSNGNDLVAWLNKAKGSFVDRYIQDFSTSDKGEQITTDYDAKYNSLKSKIDAFEQKWLA